MSLAAIKGDLSKLQVERKNLVDNRIVSKNGIVYNDPKTLIYCIPYAFILTPTIDKCRMCHEGREVLELTEEEREMYLNSDGFVTEVNHGKDEPVTGCLLLATVKEDNEFVKKIVHRKFENAKLCPKER